MANLNDLALFMDNVKSRLSVFASTKAREVAIAIFNDLVVSTPADVGTAISNWQLTLDAPATATISAFVPSPKGKVRKGIWTHAVPPAITSQANAAIALLVANRALSVKKPGQSIYITNDLEYIQELNAGSSTQAPAGFVDRAVIIGQQIVARVQFP